jgi:hypothetical protein
MRLAFVQKTSCRFTSFRLRSFYFAQKTSENLTMNRNIHKSRIRTFHTFIHIQPSIHPCIEPHLPACQNYTSQLSSHGLAQLLAPLNSSPNSLVDHLLQTSSLETLNRSMSSTVRARDITAELLGLLRRRDEHAAGSQAGLGGEARGLLERQALRDGAGDQVLDHHEEVGWAGT